jgi:poly(A) polymerase
MILTLEPPDFLRDPALQAVLAALPEARLVGGCVRDAVAGVPVADIDLATPQPPDQVLAALHAAGLRGVPTGIAHGTVTAVSAGRGFEVTTLRRDLRTDGRHAEVAFSDDWQEDAARRDFTFNALSMTRDGQVYDPFGGIADLRAGRVRFVGDPATRLAEDRLRVLRFFRFYARYAVFPPEPETLAALRNAVPDLGRLSAQTLRRRPPACASRPPRPPGWTQCGNPPRRHPPPMTTTRCAACWPTRPRMS